MEKQTAIMEPTTQERPLLTLEALRKRLLIGILAGVLVVVAVIFVLDAGSIWDALRSFNLRYLPAILALTLANYVLRFVKWQYYLRCLSVRGLPTRESALIFVAGFTMVMTPGKVGELLKAWLIRQRTGTSMTVTGPAIFAERLTDGLAMLVLAGVGLLTVQYGWQLLLVGGFLSAAVIVVVQRERLMLGLIARAGRTRLGEPRVQPMRQLYASTRTLLSTRPLLVAVTLGVFSWLGECIAYYLILRGLGVPGSTRLLVVAIFVFAAATWLGGASLLPGGLGVAEVTLTGLLLLATDDSLISSATAGSATLIMRLATLWFGVAIGVIALSRVSGWLTEAHAPAVEPVQVSADR